MLVSYLFCTINTIYLTILYIFSRTKSFFVVVGMYDPTHFNPDGMSLVELAFLFENEMIAQQFAINADLLGDYTFCGEECEGVLVPID